MVWQDAAIAFSNVTPDCASSSSQGEQSQSGQPGRRELEQLQRRLESAIRAMNDADAAMRNGGDPGELQRAADEAQRQLEGARDQATDEMRRAMQASLDNLADRARALHEDQEAMENHLQESIRGVDVARNSANRLESGMSILEEYELAEEKRQLQASVQALEQDARNTAQQIDDAAPGAADQVRDAIDNLREEEVETRIAVAASYIEIGEAVYVAGSESAVTEALRELRDDFERARRMAEGGRGDERGESEGRGNGGCRRRSRKPVRSAGSCRNWRKAVRTWATPRGAAVMTCSRPPGSRPATSK